MLATRVQKWRTSVSELCKRCEEKQSRRDYVDLDKGASSIIEFLVTYFEIL